MKKLEEERRIALGALREKQEQETQTEFENLKRVVINLKDKQAFDPEVRQLVFVQMASNNFILKLVIH